MEPEKDWEKGNSMRFGIMEMQLCGLIPANGAPKDSIDPILIFDWGRLSNLYDLGVN